MIQALTTTMAAILRASVEGLAIADKARRMKDWSKTDRAWADLAHTSPSTLRRFWAGIGIQAAAFRYICTSVGIEDWRSIVAFEAIDTGKIEEKSTLEKCKKRLVIELEADFEGIDPQKLYAVIAQLSEMGNPVMRLIDVDQGSIKLLFEGSSADCEKIRTLFNSGELIELLNIPVKNVHAVESEELTEWIRKNGGPYLNLSGVNLIGTNLMGTNLSGANLRNADLSGADLSGASLIGANLHGAILQSAVLSRTYMNGATLSRADLRSANLSGSILCSANLHGANLSGATLSDTNLGRANLSGADLDRADVMGARFGVGVGLSAKQKRDLIARGAIFDKGSREREPIVVPSPRG
jgi:hypothetical protein